MINRFVENKYKVTTAEYYLKNLKRWKTTVLLLSQTRDQLADFGKALSFSTDEMPGGNHKPITDKFNRAIEEREKYEKVICVYNFYIDQIENAMRELLTKEDRRICLIYANYYTKKGIREEEIRKNGYSLTTFYREKNKCIEILNKALEPIFEEEL